MPGMSFSRGSVAAVDNANMKHPKQKSHPMPRHDYGLALQTAVSWLGDRYVLAEPVSRRKAEHKPFFVEPRRWHAVQRSGGPGSRKH
jgi:hypothetical protein